MPYPAPPVELDLDLPSGRLRGRRFGPETGRLTIGVHGLSANSHSYDFLGEELASEDRQLVAVDLRGRGLSAITRVGTYGWNNHARDVLAIADHFGQRTFDYIGHSMGAFIGMELARQAAGRVGRMVLIDALGVPEAAALVPILSAVQRLGSIHKDADSYVSAVQRLGTVTPWGPLWETHYRYDLIEVPGGVRPRTDHAAVMEDMTYAATQQPATLWPNLTMKTLLVQAGIPLGGGFIISPSDRAEFLARIPTARAVDVDANHYGIMTHAKTASSIRSFLS